jgi:hypothetical protein
MISFTLLLYPPIVSFNPTKQQFVTKGSAWKPEIPQELREEAINSNS